MAIPRVFISSTCYDLKHIRESLKYFVRSVGYDPVLSDDGDVYYSHLSHTHDSCISEVGSCQMFVLVIGGRYGGAFKGGAKSITNQEYSEAISCGIPVFALVDSAVYADHYVYSNNKQGDGVDRELINYPSCDSTKIFSFIDEVRRASVNNGIYQFKNYSDIESYLKKQWAGMMFDFLRRSTINNEFVETKRLMGSLSAATKKTEELLKLLVHSPNINVPSVDVQAAIGRVDAEAFVLAVGDIFNIYSPIEIDPVEFDLSSIPQDWKDFLQMLPGFDLEEWDFDEESQCYLLVLMGPCGIGIGVGMETLSGDFICESNSDSERLQSSYESFYRASDDVKRYVLSRIASGHWRD